VLLRKRLLTTRPRGCRSFSQHFQTNAKMGTSISKGPIQITFVSVFHDCNPVSVDT